jgi:tetratricopeptide (TPR) repeat protein
MARVWTSYSARHAAQLIGLPESAIRSCIRDGLVGMPGTVPAQLTFRDLSALRTVKALVDAGLPLPRIRRELVRIQLGLRDGASLAELTIEARGGEVWVRGKSGVTELPGQLALPFELAPGAHDAPDAHDAHDALDGRGGLAAPEPAGALYELPRATEAPPPALIAVAPATADQWLSRALQLEDRDPVAAIDAYRRSLRLRPECTEAWINLGRMFAESGDHAAARECFTRALEIDPHDATPYYNLGVVAQDAGEEADAIELYRRALDLDPGIAEAHYNLATLFDQSGDSRAAIRHINEYRKLTR